MPLRPPGGAVYVAFEVLKRPEIVSLLTGGANWGGHVSVNAHEVGCVQRFEFKPTGAPT